MNKNLFIRNGIVLFSLAVSSQLYSQVGINTDKPAATLDVVKNPTANVLEGIIAPRISATDLREKIYTTEQTGAFLYITEGFGAIIPNGQTALIKNPGYYVFDGTEWRPFVSDVSWSTLGNSGMGNSNFIGTTNNVSMNFKVNSKPSGWIENAPYNGSTSFGYQTFSQSNPNSSNSAFGYNALNSLTIGNTNSFFGSSAGELLTIGHHNSAYGSYTGRYLVSGYNNTFAGFGSGAGIIDGYNNTHIGYTRTDYGSDTNNTIILGALSQVRTGAEGSILVGNNSYSLGKNNLIFGSSTMPGTNTSEGIKSNCIAIGNYVAPQAMGAKNNRMLANNELIINNYQSLLDDDIPLIRGSFTPGSKYFKIGGKLILEPTLTPDATGDLSYTKNVVAKADGSFGLATMSNLPVITVNSTSVSRIRLVNDIISSTTSRANIPNWNFNVTNGKVYKIKILGAYSTVATNTGGSLGFVLLDGALGAIFGKVKMNIVLTNTAAPEQVITAIDSSSTTVRSFVTSSGVGAINTPEVIDGEVIFECTADGTFNLQWGSEVASSTATLLKNSIIEVIEI